MKKLVKRLDGTEELVEGTPEEIAEYERKIKESANESFVKKPKVLKD